MRESLQTGNMFQTTTSHSGTPCKPCSDRRELYAHSARTHEPNCALLLHGPVSISSERFDTPPLTYGTSGCFDTHGTIPEIIHICLFPFYNSMLVVDHDMTCLHTTRDPRQGRCWRAARAQRLHLERELFRPLGHGWWVEICAKDMGLAKFGSCTGGTRTSGVS